MNNGVFEQYQKYFEALISRHKEACKLDSQNRHGQPPNHGEQSQTFHQQASPVEAGHGLAPMQNSSFPAAGSNGYGAVGQMPPAQPYQHGPIPDNGYYGRGGYPYFAPAGPPIPPPSVPPPPVYPMYPFHHPDDYCRYYYASRYRDTFPADNPMMHPPQQQQQQQQQQMQPLPPQQSKPMPAPLRTFSPDGRLEPVLPDDVEKKKPTFCYPNSVNGFQGVGLSGPCGRCSNIAQESVGSVDNPISLKDKLQSRGSRSGHHVEQTVGQVNNAPCAGKNCPNVWPSASDAATAGAAVASEVARNDAAPHRLPLGAQEPFNVGPTSYQYFYDVDLP